MYFSYLYSYILHPYSRSLLIYNRRNIGKDDFVIPRPPSSPDTYSRVILSWVAAMKYVGMSSYCEELVYPGVDNGGASESMNDANLEEMEPLSLRNLEIFKEYKENLRRGAVSHYVICRLMILLLCSAHCPCCSHSSYLSPLSIVLL